MANYAYLLMVTTNNNNKYYEMKENSDGSFTAYYGRVGANPQTRTYPMSRWNSTIRSKISKGYIDQTNLVAEEVPVNNSNKDEYRPIPDEVIRKIVNRLQSFAQKTIARNYKVSSTKVTQSMVDTAQSIINELLNQQDINEFNSVLIRLFNTIPRKMSNVKDHVAKDKNDFSEIITNEQSLLDVMKGQIVVNEIVEDNSIERKNETILEAMGLIIERTTEDDVKKIKTELGEIKNRYADSWKVTNKKTQKKFEKMVKENKINNIKMLWHGTRSENVFNILKTGLILRPSAVITGKMFGWGIYFAPKAKKSLGYTSINGSYWSRGSNKEGFMLLFDVAYGKPYDVYSFNSKYYDFNYNKLQETCTGANCLHAHAGQMLRNDEIIIYKEEQSTIKYLVELK